MVSSQQKSARWEQARAPLCSCCCCGALARAGIQATTQAWSCSCRPCMLMSALSHSADAYKMELRSTSLPCFPRTCDLLQCFTRVYTHSRKRGNSAEEFSSTTTNKGVGSQPHSQMLNFIPIPRHRVIDWFGLEGAFKDHLVQITSCPSICPLGLHYFKFCFSRAN